MDLAHLRQFVLFVAVGVVNTAFSYGIFAGLEFLGVPFAAIQEGLASFTGVDRRFQLRGEAGGVTVIDDYGHHPTEIQATIAAIKNNWPDRRLVVLFQPHRYSRTAHLYRDFGKAFGQADQVQLFEIYPAGEKPIPGVSSQLIYKCMKENGVEVEHYKELDLLVPQLQSGDIVLTLGAGDVWKTGEELLKLI
jgi:UDP-N-acetylmuramate--alanine ligase